MFRSESMFWETITFLEASPHMKYEFGLGGQSRWKNMNKSNVFKRYVEVSCQ